MLNRFLVFLFIICFSIKLYAQVDITNIDYSPMGNNKYKVTFSLDEQAYYKISHEEKKIIINFTNVKLSFANILKKIDGRFIKSIMQSDNEANNLAIIINLAENCTFFKSYSVLDGNKFSLTIETINSNIKHDYKKIKNSKKPHLKKLIIMIDPGHGGNDKGTIGSSLNTYEKNLVLAYAKELRKELKKYPQYEIYMTRSGDEFITSEARRELAKNKKADVFISLHADFNNDKHLSGASIYTLSQEGIEKQASSLLEQENKANILKNDKLLKQNKTIANILISIVYQNTNNASIYLAKTITNILKKDIRMLQKPHRSAELKVLKGVDIPAILVELGYLSNKEEEELLNTTKHKKIFTQALVQGLNEYFESLNKPLS